MVLNLSPPCLAQMKTATFDNSSRKDGTDHFHHRFLKIDMDNIRLQVKTIGMIVFTCRKNLECLCSVTELFMDGTYTFCPKFFKQLYTIHGFQNGHYVPLVFIPDENGNI
jgi:hypothetical protein